MIAVAMVAMILGVTIEVTQMKRRQDLYLSRANTHSTKEHLYNFYLKVTFDRMKNFSKDYAGDPYQKSYIINSFNIFISDAEKLARLEEYHSNMKEKYLEAASRPWKAVKPDPPEPK